MLLSSSNRKYQPYPLLSYFPVVVCLRCLLHHILSLIANTFRENRDFVFIIIVQFNKSDAFWLADSIRLFVYNIISLSSLCKLIWRHWTYKMPVRYILSRVWVRLSIFSQFPLNNIWGCVFSVYPSPLWWLRQYILCLAIIIKSEVWTITHCLWLGHETMVCAVCLYILVSIFHGEDFKSATSMSQNDRKCKWNFASSVFTWKTLIPLSAISHFVQHYVKTDIYFYSKILKDLACTHSKYHDSFAMQLCALGVLFLLVHKGLVAFYNER